MHKDTTASSISVLHSSDQGGSDSPRYMQAIDMKTDPDEQLCNSSFDSIEKSNGSYAHRYRVYVHMLIWLALTGFISAAYALQIPKGYNQELLVLSILYVYITCYIIFCHIPTTTITTPWRRGIHAASNLIHQRTSYRIRTVLYGLIVLGIIVATVFSFPEKEESPRLRRLISLFGLFVFVFGTFAASVHRKHVQWNTVITAMLMQFLLALFVFRSSVGHDLFKWISDFAEGYLHNAWYGAEFVFGTAAVNANTFALNVFPALIFFASTVQVLYYLGTIQWILKKLAAVFIATLGISGAESIVAVASPFLGACENALLIEPLVPTLTKSEIHQILTSGFATISGSVLYGYIAMGVSGQALLTSCIMSIPCSVAISKLRYPETEESDTKDNANIPGHQDDDTANMLHALGKGAEMGVKIALLIMANIISILGALYAINSFLTWLGNFLTIKELTLELVTGYLFVPIAWLIGADDEDLVIVGRLMATKIWSNEFIAYKQLTDTYKGQLSARSQLVTTYALCGFANFGSVGMQVGVLGTLAPSRTGEISHLAISALICGSLSTWLSASIAGMLI
ncbi:H+ nucleoside cotransporter protein [Mucor ambiguus]|uniref:H+ nucleoside cotransporter protein n=1 Tax=Mucor ambiguus TaxID=91626 RepID=A0A0C9N0F4_9FUNG|nr:H+ nucleoside cotransporter protein [Mucor ambiguus]